MSGSKNNFRRDHALNEESVDDRMRIFEDEIIKRIKIIQNFVKNMDGKVNRMKASQKFVANDSQKKYHNQLSSRHGTSMENSNTDERRPERLRDLNENEAPLGAN